MEKFCGREIGIAASKNFSVHLDQTSQAHFSVFQGLRTHQDNDILKAQAFIEESYTSDISVDEVAKKCNMSKRNFIRRFKQATKNTSLEYLQRVRVEAAKKAPENNIQNVSSVMYDIGYNDVKTFREVLKRVTGLTPQAYRRKYSRELNSA